MGKVVTGSPWGSALYLVSSLALSSTGELNSRLSSDTKLMSCWLPLNANVLLRSLVKVVGLYGFMLSLSPRLALLSLLKVPLAITAEKVYNVRHQVCGDVRGSLYSICLFAIGLLLWYNVLQVHPCCCK